MDNLLIPIVYALLLFLMVLVLYYCGKEMAKTGKVFSKAGFIAILTFTLNEGLRFGRGIDYNGYGIAFERYENGETIDKEFLYSIIIRFLISADIPYQGLIFIQSFLFIVCLLLFLINYRDILPIALPLFVLFSLGIFENLIRWFMGFSCILLGLSQLVKGKHVIYYFILSSLSLLFHIGLLPIPILIYLIYRLKKIIVSPVISISVYVLTGLFLKTDVMLYFVDYVNWLSMFIERADGYANNAEKWLTSGALGLSLNSFDSMLTLIYLIVIVWFGYRYLRINPKAYFVYNLFVVGFMIKPLANRIELLTRYNHCFYCFGAVMVAYLCVYNSKIIKELAVRIAMIAVVFAFHLNYFRRPFVNPQYYYLYVWDIGNRTYGSMHSLWIKGMLEDANRK